MPNKKQERVDDYNTVFENINKAKSLLICKRALSQDEVSKSWMLEVYYFLATASVAIEKIILENKNEKEIK